VALQRANAHFSEDILSAVLNEPIAGQGVFWSSANQRPYPVALRALSFELLYTARDLHGELGAVQTFAGALKAEFARRTSELVSTVERNDGSLAQKQHTLSAGDGAASTGGVNSAESAQSTEQGAEQGVDMLAVSKQLAIQRLRTNTTIMNYLRGEKGQHWRGIGEFLQGALPPEWPDAEQLAFSWVREALDAVLGKDAWETHEVWNGSKHVKYVRVKREPGETPQSSAIPV
jgi:hypothetical protein